MNLINLTPQPNAQPDQAPTMGYKSIFGIPYARTMQFNNTPPGQATPAPTVPTPYQLKEGVDVIQPGPRMSAAFQSAYKQNPDFPRGHLESLAMQESSMNNRDTNYNPINGRFGYVFGLTSGAFTDTKTSPQDANTLEGAANVAAKYYSMRSKLHDASGNVVQTLTKPSDIYNRYTVPSAHPDKTFNPQKYDAMVDYYARPASTTPQIQSQSGRTLQDLTAR